MWSNQAAVWQPGPCIDVVVGGTGRSSSGALQVLLVAASVLGWQIGQTRASYRSGGSTGGSRRLRRRVGW